MNIKITRNQHEELEKCKYKEYLFGSRLHGIAKKDSDSDYVRVIEDSFYSKFKTLGKFFPNIHSWQHDFDTETQYVWMTETQFYRNLFSGDGNMIADIVLLSGEFSNPLKLCRTYKIIKGYLGVAKRDLKMHGKNEKKKFHAYRSLTMARLLLSNIMPTVRDISSLKDGSTPTTADLFTQERELRYTLNKYLMAGSIDMYPSFKEEDELVQIMIDCNNIKEFKYD